MKKVWIFGIMTVMLLSLMSIAFAGNNIVAPVLSVPVATTYQEMITISWAESLNGGNASVGVVSYTIDLYLDTGTLSKYFTIINNITTAYVSGAAKTYTWNSTQNGTNTWHNYSIAITAWSNITGGPFVGYSPTFKLDNSPPSVTSVTVNPHGDLNPPRCVGSYADTTNTTVSVESGSTYRWWKNGALISGETSKAFGSSRAIGDSLICEYRPKDGYWFGTTSNSSSTIVTDEVTSTGCNSTKTTIFAAFALIAVALIAGLAYLLINMGDLSPSVLMAAVIGAIGLCVVLFVGYIIISQVATSMC